MTFLPLSSLLAIGRSAAHPVSLVADGMIPFARFAAQVAATAKWLRASQFQRVALVCQDSDRFAVGLFAALHTATTLVLPPNGRAGTLQVLRDAFDVLLDDVAIARAGTADLAFAPIDATNPSLEFFTSGSTGSPKRIVKTLQVLERETETLERLWGADLDDNPVLATVTHQHIYGLTFKLLWPMAAGRPFGRETHELWEPALAALSQGATVISTPAHLARLTGIAPLPEPARPRRIFSAGAPLSRTASDEVTAILGTRPTEIFGSTETGAIATRTQIAAEEPWRLLPGMEIDRTSDGCMILRSPFLIQDAWLETADRIEPVAGGFHLLGRADRIAKIEGKRIGLPDVETALIQLPWITEAAVVVLPGLSARLAAIVVLSTEGRAEQARLGNFWFGRLLRQALTATQEPAGLPRSWRFCDALPSGPMGKRNDAALLALFGHEP